MISKSTLYIIVGQLDSPPYQLRIIETPWYLMVNFKIYRMSKKNFQQSYLVIKGSLGRFLFNPGIDNLFAGRFNWSKVETIGDFS